MRRARMGIPLVVAVMATTGWALAGPAHASPGQAHGIPESAVCHATRPQSQALAARLSDSLLHRMRRQGSAVTFRDDALGVGCRVRGHWRTESASIIKIAIIAALGIQRSDHGWNLTRRQRAWARDAIRWSDNASAVRLWNALGRRRGFARYTPVLGMAGTRPGRGTHWGHTLTSAVAQMGLLRALQSQDSAVPEGVRRLILSNMARVVAAQRWGISAGLTASTDFANKNGWVTLEDLAWRVHSIGIVYSPSGSYSLAILTDGNRSMKSGIRRVQSIARVINRAVARHTPKR